MDAAIPMGTAVHHLLATLALLPPKHVLVVTQAAVPAVAPAAAAASFMLRQFVNATSSMDLLRSSPVQLRSPTECLHKNSSTRNTGQSNGKSTNGSSEKYQQENQFRGRRNCSKYVVTPNRLEECWRHPMPAGFRWVGHRLLLDALPLRLAAIWLSPDGLYFGAKNVASVKRTSQRQTHRPASNALRYILFYK